jgi:hypothetical protein
MPVPVSDPFSGSLPDCREKGTALQGRDWVLPARLPQADLKAFYRFSVRVAEGYRVSHRHFSE